MPVQIIKSESAPQPIGPYSQAIEANGFIFISGQIALHPVTGQIISRDILAQTRRVLENIEAILNAAGSSFNHVVKTTIFLKSMDDFPVVNEIYGKYFSQSLPARSTVEVSRLPKNVLIEIECVALKND